MEKTTYLRMYPDDLKGAGSVVRIDLSKVPAFGEKRDWAEILGVTGTPEDVPGTRYVPVDVNQEGVVRFPAGDLDDEEEAGFEMDARAFLLMSQPAAAIVDENVIGAIIWADEGERDGRRSMRGTGPQGEEYDLEYWLDDQDFPQFSLSSPNLALSGRSVNEDERAFRAVWETLDKELANLCSPSP